MAKIAKIVKSETIQMSQTHTIHPQTDKKDFCCYSADSVCLFYSYHFIFLSRHFKLTELPCVSECNHGDKLEWPYQKEPQPLSTKPSSQRITISM